MSDPATRDDVSHLSATDGDELVRAARTATGDELRSVRHFTEDAAEQLYLRRELDRTTDLVGFTESERHGFHARSLYRDTQLGAYQFTVRVFANGCLTQVITNGHGVWVTTHLEIDRFEALAAALRALMGVWPCSERLRCANKSMCRFIVLPVRDHDVSAAASCARNNFRSRWIASVHLVYRLSNIMSMGTTLRSILSYQRSWKRGKSSGWARRR